MAFCKTRETYNGWDSEVVLLGIVEELETDLRQCKFTSLSTVDLHIIASDDTGFSGKDVSATHVCSCVGVSLMVWLGCGEGLTRLISKCRRFTVVEMGIL